MSTRRVVITGLGAVTPLGNNVSEFWDGLTQGRSGIGTITLFDASQFSCQIAGEVKGFDPAKVFKVPKDARRSDRYMQLGVAAAKEAMLDSGLSTENTSPERIGVFVGSGIGGLKTISDQHGVLMEKGPDRISPFMVPMMIANMASGIIAIEFGCKGPNSAIVTACATAAQSIGEAWRCIRDNDMDACLAGGTEAACTELGIGGFASMKALSTRNDAPEKASRPFDTGRDGFVLGEGAGVVVLEELDHARRRGARIYAELTGYGTTCDASHMSAPDPDGAGAARAITIALNRAGLNPSDIGYINAHATSTPLGDGCEIKAIKRAFGAQAHAVAVSSTKSMTGHLLGAAGAIELIACINAIRFGVVPPTINIDHQDPECDLDVVPNTARTLSLRHAISNSFGFGGHKACLAVSRFA